MAIGGVIVVPRPIEIGGHKAERIKAMLSAQCPAELDAGDFAWRTTHWWVVLRLETFLSDRLLGKL